MARFLEVFRLSGREPSTSDDVENDLQYHLAEMEDLLMARGATREVAREGIRVNAVAPGLVLTDIHAAGGEPGRAERIAPTIPMGRPGAPEEIAEPILFLLSPAASYITGAVLRVSGGR